MNLKHIFGFWASLFYIENPCYLYPYYYCKICGMRVDDLFESKGKNYSGFGSAFEQEEWLDKNAPCLTEEEYVIKKLLE
jgi:hypothetical protein